MPKAGPRRPLQAVPRLALTREEAAASLGMSVSHFERNVQPTMRVVRSGQLVLIPISEVERWLQRNATWSSTRSPGLSWCVSAAGSR